MPDWEYVALNGRDVFVVYDSDIYLKPDVERALKALYALLRGKGAVPRIVQWPEAYRQQKWGVDDFFAQGHTLDELRTMLPVQGPLSERPPPPARPRITFDLGKGGEPRLIVANILHVLEQDPAWKGVLGFNELLNDVVFLQRPPCLPAQDGQGGWTPRPVTEQDHSETANWLQRTYQFYAGSLLTAEGMTTYGCRSPFHPIRDYLLSLTWDTVPPAGYVAPATTVMCPTPPTVGPWARRR